MRNKVVLGRTGFALHHDPSAIRAFRTRQGYAAAWFYPDPDGPTIAVRFSGVTLRFKLSSTCASENDLEMDINSNIMAVFGLRLSGRRSEIKAIGMA